MNYLLYIIVFLEGFTTLSVQIMAMRNSITIIGSNSIATSIIIGVVLLALSYGYYRGGSYAANNSASDIKAKIFWNLLIASLFYTLVSFPFQNMFLEYMLGWGIGYFVPIIIGITLLFAFPVFLASQTIPLISELVTDEKKPIVIGKLLFFSTIGSFLGSVITSLVFFAYIGVEKSIVVNGIILSVLALLILIFFHKKAHPAILWVTLAYLLILLSAFFVDYRSIGAPVYRVFIHSSEYNNIEVYDNGKTRMFMMNGSYSSGLDIATGKSFFGYILETTRIIDEYRPKRVLIIGAAGFSLPQDIADREFIEVLDVCDIDGSLDVIAERHFLKEPLHPKINFEKKSARYLINEKIREGKKYDLIFLDAYNGRISIPSELLTKEFFESVSAISEGLVVMNLIHDSDQSSRFYKNVTNTLLSVFPDMSYKSMNGGDGYYDNYIAINTPTSGYTGYVRYPGYDIYVDDKNTLEKDKYDLFYSQLMN